MLAFLSLPHPNIVRSTKASLGCEDVVIGDQGSQADWYFQFGLVLHYLPNIIFIFSIKLND